MHHLPTLLQDLHAALESDKIGAAFQLLKKAILPATEAHKSYILLSGKYSGWKTDKNQGTKSEDQIELEKTRIRKNLLDFFDEIREEDISPNYKIDDEIFDNILVFCADADRIEYMQKYFSTEYYQGVKYKKPGDEFDWKTFDIILFDAYGFSNLREEATRWLRTFLDHDQEKPLVMYFGGREDLLNQYPEKAYASGFIFSIHARLREMLDFMKYKRKD